MRTQPRGLADRHRGAHAVHARLVRGGRHDAAPAGLGADDDGLAAQLRAIALLDGRVERVHVDVRDRRGRGTRATPTLNPGSTDAVRGVHAMPSTFFFRGLDLGFEPADAVHELLDRAATGSGRSVWFRSISPVTRWPSL